MNYFEEKIVFAWIPRHTPTGWVWLTHVMRCARRASGGRIWGGKVTVIVYDYQEI